MRARTTTDAKGLAVLTHHDEGDVAVITLNRPDRRNALNIELCDMLGETIHAKVARDARAIVITGEGTSFCSGADLDAVYGDAFLTSLYGLFAKMLDAPMPIIAAINGPAIGAGTQLALACDLRIASDSAVFAVPIARNGLAVDPWTVRRLTEIAGGGVARRLLLAAGQLDRDEALASGLVDRTGSVDDAIAWATEIASFAPMSLAFSKKVLNNPETSVADEATREQFLACFASEDVTEAKQARLDKRSPVFKGR